MRNQKSFNHSSGYLCVFFVVLLLLSVAACRSGANLPAKNSKEYTEMVSAFYTGLSALQVGDDVRAENRLKEATEIVPDEPASWANLGLLALRQREYESAAEKIEKARTLAPENAQIYVLLGLLETSRGKSAEAIKNFRRAVELNPQDLKAIYALATEIEREGGEASNAEVQQLLERILAVQPNNLAVQLDITRLAAKRGDADALRRMVTRLNEQSASWPPEVKEQLNSLQSAADGPNPRQAASRVAFLRNVLVRLPEFRESVLAVKDPPEVLGQPFVRFIKLESPSNSPSPPDEALTFTLENLPASDAAGDDWAWSGGVFLNGDELPIIAFANGREVRLANGAKLNFPGGPSATSPTANGVVQMDFNYDFKIDLVLAGAGGVRLLRRENATRFIDETPNTRLPATITNARYDGAWPADIEADGDLDIVLGPSEGAPLVLRNNGDGSFAEMRPFDGVDVLREFAWADIDADGDVDAALLDARGALFVFTNERAGQFRARALPQDAGRAVAIEVADVNNDGYFDLLALQPDGMIKRYSDKLEGRDWNTGGVARWTGTPSSLSTDNARLFVADLDNNGSVDLLASSASGLQAWLSDQQGNFKPINAAPAEMRIFSVADITNDGRLDLIGLSTKNAPVKAINQSKKNYHWQALRPRAANVMGDQRINSFGIGGEMEIRSGLLVQKAAIAGPIVHFGLGEQERADVVRIVWPNGSLRAEFELKADQAVVAEQRLKGSCPMLFAFDGKEMRFVKDCPPWSPALGLRINAQDTMGILQTEEWVKIRGDQLTPRDGLYDLRITAELWETYYVDHYSLMVVDHPEDTEIFVDERFSIPPPPQLAVYAVEKPRPFVRALDDNGNDVTEIVRELDAHYLDNFGRGKYQGLTRDHFVELELNEDAPVDGPLWLIAHGWLHPTDGSINVAIGQGSEGPPRGLSLEVADGNGGWAVAKQSLGFPAGKAKTIMVDLSGVFRPGAPRRLRLRTNMEIFWDKLEWARGLPGAQLKVERLNPTSAELRFRGFSPMNRANESSPELPEYRVIDTTQRWRDLEGYYTRYGDIRELLEKIDDRFVIVNAGDEMAFGFRALPPPPAGWRRDFVLVSDGWIKDGDYNTLFSKTVLPLPTHLTNDYTRPPTRLEDDPVYQRHKEDWQKYHTRYVAPDRFRRVLRVE